MRNSSRRSPLNSSIGKDKDKIGGYPNVVFSYVNGKFLFFTWVGWQIDCFIFLAIWINMCFQF